MRSLVLMFLLTITSSLSFAQGTSVENQADAVADLLRREARYLTLEERERIARLLGEITLIVRQGDQDPDQSAQYTCVSRDNDGRSPYVFAIRQGIQVQRIGMEIFSSNDDCDRTLRSFRVMQQNNFFCASKDNDGRSPYTLATLSGTTITRLKSIVSSAKHDCENQLQALRPRQGRALLCTARDADGRSPYVAVSLDLRSLQIERGSESFQTMEACNRFIMN